MSTFLLRNFERKMKMNDVLSRIYEELEKKKISPSDMCKELKIANSTFFTWKTKDKIPPTESLIVISNFLDTTIDYLVNGVSPAWQPVITYKDEKDIKKALDAIKNQLSTGTGLMYDGEPMDEESMEAVLKAIEVAERTALLEAKRRYTPYKYRK